MENEIISQEQIESIPPNIYTNRDSFQTLYDISKMFAASSLVPQSYQGRPQDCMIAIDMANRMGVSPMMVMQNLYVVKGKPGWSGQACMTLITGCGKFRDVKPIYTGDKGTDGRGCYIQAVIRSSGDIVAGTEVTMTMAKAEGWLSNPKWKNMPEQMLAYRAAAFFARVYCPEALMGVQLADEIVDVSREKPAVDNPFTGGEGNQDEADG